MAHVLAFPAEITSFIYSMRDWRLEEVRKEGGTPSCLARLPFKITSCIPLPDINHKYWICVENRFIHPGIWILALSDDDWSNVAQWEWADNLYKGNDDFDARHGPHISRHTA